MTMRLIQKILAIVVVYVVLISAALGADGPTRLLFAPDMSDSFAVTVHAHVARAAGNLVEREIMALSPGDEVRILSFGEAGISQREIDVSVALSRRAQARPRRIAPVMATLIRSIPERVEAGQLRVQSRTNIVGFLEALAPSLACADQRTRLIIFTDGIEWSTHVRGDELLAGTADLPSPSGRILEGCEVVMRGLGQVVRDQNTDSRWFPVLRQKWAVFFDAAGVRSFSAYAEFE